MVVISPLPSPDTGSEQDRSGRVEQDGAGAALGDAATEFGARQTEIVAQDPKHRRVGPHIDGMGLPVHLDAELRHPVSPDPLSAAEAVYPASSR